MSRSVLSSAACFVSTVVLLTTRFSAVTERILARDPNEEIRRAFQLFDDDGKGKIDLRNLRRVAKELGEPLDDEELYVMTSCSLIFLFLELTSSHRSDKL